MMQDHELPVAASPSSALPDPCAVCNGIARALIRESQQFGSRVARTTAIAERVCNAHLPLVVGMTDPRNLARWLRQALREPCLDGAPCSLCVVEDKARADLASLPSGAMSCRQHGGVAPASMERLESWLDRIAASERLQPDIEHRVLRTALVLYASTLGTSAYVPRID
ncbi:MAG TPA: hypothetical protein VIA45_11655 [Thermoanaerobaculia bacterium]